MPPIRFIVDRRENGQTLASVLKVRYRLSWAQAKRLIERRHVKVSGQIESNAARRLKVGKRVEVEPGTIELPTAGTTKPPEKQAREPARRAEMRKARPKTYTHRRSEKCAADSPGDQHLLPDIVYQDDAVVVVNKPAGLTTMRHAEEAAEFGTRAKRYLPKTLADILPPLLGASSRKVIAVHRIDRDTSGLVVFALTRTAAVNLTKQFRKHTVDRRYLALTRGVPSAGRIDSILVRDRGDGRRGSATGNAAAGGRRAVTHVSLLEKVDDHALVQCRLETGRTHQVRIHLGEAGTPLCGERIYDRALHGQPKSDRSGAKRPMLHAARLGFRHPITAEPMFWEVEPPEDFRAVEANLRAIK